MLLVIYIALQHNLKIKTDTSSMIAKSNSFSIHNQRHDRLGIHIKITQMCKNRLCYQSAFYSSFEWTVSWGNWVYWMFYTFLLLIDAIKTQTLLWFAINTKNNIATNRYFVNEIHKKSNILTLHRLYGANIKTIMKLASQKCIKKDKIYLRLDKKTTANY